MLPLPLEGALGINKALLQPLDPQRPSTEERETAKGLETPELEQRQHSQVYPAWKPHRHSLRLYSSGSAAEGIGCPHRRPSAPSTHMVGGLQPL